MLLTILVRLPALLHPLAIDDERIYSVVAGEMLHGVPPYLGAIERKPPLLFGVFAAVLGIAGPTAWPALHLVAIAWTLATMAGIGLLIRELFNPRAGLAAGLLYGLFQMWGDYRNLAFNGELLMNLPIVLAYGLAFRRQKRRWRPELLAAGGLIGVAFLLKQPAGIAGAPLAWYVLSPGYRRSRGLVVGDSLWHAAELALGLVAVLGASALLLAHWGILDEAWYWTIVNHRDPVGPSTWHFWERALGNTAFFVGETLPLWLGVVAAVRTAGSGRRPLWQDHPSERGALLLLLVVSLIGVSSSGQFLFHYYLQLLPALCLLAGPAFGAAWAESPRSPRPLPSWPPLRAWLVLTLVAFTTIDAIGLQRQRAGSPTAVWLAAHAAPGDRLFVWGHGGRMTGIYLESGLRPASRFVATFPLTGHVFGGYPAAWGPAYRDARVLPGGWDTLELDFKTHPPRFIVDGEGVRAALRYPIRRYPRLAAIVQREYRAIDTLPDGILYERIEAASSGLDATGEMRAPRRGLTRLDQLPSREPR